jgi:LysM repeat protein
MRISILITCALIVNSCGSGNQPVEIPPADDFSAYLDTLGTGTTEEVITISEETTEEDPIEYSNGEITFNPGSVKWSATPKTFSVDLHLEIVQDTIYKYSIRTTGGSTSKQSFGDSDNVVYHTVKPGETLSELAEKYKVKVKCVNNGKPLYVGTKIKIVCE